MIAGANTTAWIEPTTVTTAPLLNVSADKLLTGGEGDIVFPVALLGP